MKKAIKWLLVTTMTLTSLTTYGKESPDIQVKKSLAEIAVKVAKVQPSEQRSRLLNFFNNLQNVDVTTSKKFKKMKPEEKANLVESTERLKLLARDYEQAMLSNPDLDSVQVALAFADETEQAGVIIILLALAAGALLTLGIIAKLIDDAWDGCTDPYYC